MGFLDMAKQSAARNLNAPTASVAHGDGCELHSMAPSKVGERWRQVEAIIAATPEDDHDAQWGAIGVCRCCCGPAKVATLVCSHCEGADLDELRQAPPCYVCGAQGYTIRGRAWYCPAHAGEAADDDLEVAG